MNVSRVRGLAPEQRATIKRARDEAARARLPKDTLGRTIVTRTGTHRETR